MNLINAANVRVRKRSVGNALSIAAVATVLSLLLTTVLVSAQDEGKAGIRVKDISLYHVNSPRFSESGVPVRAVHRQRWLAIVLEYESSGGDGEWINRLTLDWHVALRGEGKPVIMNRSVTYADIEDGEHYSVVFVRPSIIRRYYSKNKVSKRDVLIYVPITANGNSLGQYLYPEDRDRHPSGWWDYGSPRVVREDSGLLSRNKTPFYPLDYDAFEHILERSDQR